MINETWEKKNFEIKKPENHAMKRRGGNKKKKFAYCKFNCFMKHA